jgi:hypothetical protein
VIAATTSSQLGSMFVFFLIALAIVSPFGYRRIRAVRRERRAFLGLDQPDEPHDAPVSGTPSRAVDDLANVVDAIAVAGAELAREPGGTRIVDVPIHPLVEGRPSSPAVVDALLSDAVRRSGLRSEWISGNRPGRQLLLTADDA